MRKLVLCEKPSVARDLARALGVPTAGGGPFTGEGLVITWCIGHLIELAEPTTYSPAWRRWSFATLPMLPDAFALQPIKKTQAQWRVVRDLLRRRDFAAVVNACDAGREGELIFRFCYELADCTLPIERLWISALTDTAIRRGMASLRSGRDLDALAAAARCRAQADWLVGLNATRAVTLWRGGQTLLSLGRVQTPTLGMIVARDDEIARFVPRDYSVVEALLKPGPGAAASPAGGSFVARYAFGDRRRFASRQPADAVVARDAQVGFAIVERLEEKTVREPPPLLFDLGALQRTCNRRFGWSADGTLKLAQALYERHKLITYPRTDSRYLASDLAPGLHRLFAAAAGHPTYAPYAQPLLAQAASIGMPRRVFADAKVTDHHAIIPTPTELSPDRLQRLSDDDPRLLQLLDLIVRRFLAAFYPDAEFRETRVGLRVDAGSVAGQRPPALPTTAAEAGARDADGFLLGLPPPPDRYQARGRVRIQAGWQAVAGFGDAPRSHDRGTESQGTASGSGKGDARRRKRASADVAGAVDASPDDDSRDGADDAAQDDAGPDAQDLPPLVVGQRLPGSFARRDQQTRPPPRYSEATLLSAMEGAGKTLDDDALRQAMRDHGLGTPATRAAIIETLLDRGYIARRGKQLFATPLGAELIHALPVPALASAELTGRWEARLAAMARGKESPRDFMHDIQGFVADLVSRIGQASVPATALPVGGTGKKARSTGRAAPASRGKSLTPRTQRTPRKRTRPDTEEAAPAAGSRRKRSTADGSARAPRRTARPTRSRGRTTEVESPRTGDTGPTRASRARTRGSTRSPRAAATSITPGRSPQPRPVDTTPSPAAQPSTSTSTSPGSLVTPRLLCPRCGQAPLLWGKRGWGCSSFRTCPFVLPFVVHGQRLSVADLRLLCSGLPLYVADGEHTRAIRLHPGRSEAPFLVPI